MVRRYLSLVRHAKSSWRAVGVGDRNRPLNKRGIEDCRRVPAIVARRLPAPGKLLVSTATRTVQTAQALQSAFGLPDSAVQLEPDLYLASPSTMLSLIAQHGADTAHLMVVGHNPGTTDLYNLLTSEELDNMPTLGIGHLEILASSWSVLGPGQARVVDLITPKQLGPPNQFGPR